MVFGLPTCIAIIRLDSRTAGPRCWLQWRNAPLDPAVYQKWSYKVPLPSSLDCLVLDTSTTYCCVNSRPITLLGLSKGNCSELLGVLIGTLHSEFKACPSPESFLARANVSKHCTQLTGRNVVLAGASNLCHCANYLASAGMKVTSLSKPGWVASKENIAEMSSGVRAMMEQGCSAVIFYLYRNSSVRFTQFDGTTALPFKSGGRFHLNGDVVACPVMTFKGIVKSTIPILNAAGNTPCIVIPPLPKYIFAGCCSDPDHCVNLKNPEHKEKLLSDFIQLRHILIKELIANSVKNFKVLDTCSVTALNCTANTSTRIAALADVTAQDGVHFTSDGYFNLARSIGAGMDSLAESRPPKRRQKQYFWRGFRSVLGSDKLCATPGPPGNSAPLRGRSWSLSGRRYFHPYRK